MEKGTSNLTDGGPFTGTATASFTVVNLAVRDSGDYNCIVTNNCGQVISASGILTVNKGTPAITFTSPNLRGTEGDQLIISAVSSSPAPITFSVTGGTGQGSLRLPAY